MNENVYKYIVQRLTVDLKGFLYFLNIILYYPNLVEIKSSASVAGMKNPTSHITLKKYEL